MLTASGSGVIQCGTKAITIIILYTLWKTAVQLKGLSGSVVMCYDEVASQGSWVRFLLFSSPEPKAQETFFGGLISNLSTWVNGIQICSNEGPHTFPRGDNNERKCIDKILKSSPEPQGQFQPNLA